MFKTIELPWPPSVNHYYRYVGPRVLISRDGHKFRDAVAVRLRSAGFRKFTGPVELVIDLYPPDRRRRDIDNCMKSLLDAFTHGGLYDDDCQVKVLHAEMREPMPDKRFGMAVVRISDHEIHRTA